LKEMIIEGVKYDLTYEEDGKPVLKRYNDKYKMWEELVFSTEQDSSINERVTEMLSKIFINDLHSESSK